MSLVLISPLTQPAKQTTEDADIVTTVSTVTIGEQSASLVDKSDARRRPPSWAPKQNLSRQVTVRRSPLNQTPRVNSLTENVNIRLRNDWHSIHKVLHCAHCVPGSIYR